MNPKALEEAMEAKRAPRMPLDGVEPRRAGSRGRRRMRSADRGRRPTQPLPAAPTRRNEPLRFTVRNEILHGPVLGLSGLGIARVNSHLVLSEETRKKITEIFGPKDPLEVSTRVGFFGGGTTTFKSEGRTIKPKDGKAEITWETFKRRHRLLDATPTSTTSMASGRSSRSRTLEDNTHFVMTDMTMDGDGKRVRGDLYDGDFTFAIDKLSVVGKDDEDRSRSRTCTTSSTSATKDDFIEMGAKLGSGAVKSQGARRDRRRAQGNPLRLRRAPPACARRSRRCMAGDQGDRTRSRSPMRWKPNKVMFAPLKEHGVGAAQVRPGVRHRSHRHRDARGRWLHQGRDHAQGRDRR